MAAEVAFNETIYTGVPSDTWPSVWAKSGRSFAMGGDMPGQGNFSCPPRHLSYTNSFEIDMTSPRSAPAPAAAAAGPGPQVDLTLLSCSPVPLQEVFDVCSGGHEGSVFTAPNLKPVSMVGLDDENGTVLAVVQCVYEGPCVRRADNAEACDDPTYPVHTRPVEPPNPRTPELISVPFAL